MAKTKKDASEINESNENDFFKSAVVNKLKKDFGVDICVPLSEVNDEERGIIKTYPSLDMNLGGGFLRGTLIQLAGKPKVGKTTLALAIAAFFQEQFPDKHVIYYKAEGRLSKSVVDGIKKLNQSRVIVVQSTEEKILSVQDTLEIQGNLMREFPGSLHIIDSVSGMASNTELDNKMSDEQYCGISKVLAKWCRKNGPVYGVTNSTIIALNHIRSNVKSTAGGSYTTGGYAWHHQLDTNLWLNDAWKDGKIESSNGESIGKNVIIETKTTVMAKPNTETTLSLIFGSGFSGTWDIFNLGLQLGIIVQAGSWYSYGEIKLGQGKLNVIELLEKDEAVLGNIHNDIKKMIGE